jgi:hypothetical protein
MSYRDLCPAGSGPACAGPASPRLSPALTRSQRCRAAAPPRQGTPTGRYWRAGAGFTGPDPAGPAREPTCTAIGTTIMHQSIRPAQVGRTYQADLPGTDTRPSSDLRAWRPDEGTRACPARPKSPCSGGCRQRTGPHRAEGGERPAGECGTSGGGNAVGRSATAISARPPASPTVGRRPPPGGCIPAGSQRGRGA